MWNSATCLLRLGENIDHSLWSALCLIKNPKARWSWASFWWIAWVLFRFLHVSTAWLQEEVRDLSSHRGPLAISRLKLNLVLSYKNRSIWWWRGKKLRLGILSISLAADCFQNAVFGPLSRIIWIRWRNLQHCKSNAEGEPTSMDFGVYILRC